MLFRSGEVGPVPMAFVGVENTYAESGTPDELLDKYGLRAKNIAAAVRGVHGKNAARQAGRVLHDQVGSSLAAAALQLQLVKMDHASAAPAVSVALAHLDGALNAVREVSQKLLGR